VPFMLCAMAHVIEHVHHHAAVSQRRSRGDARLVHVRHQPTRSAASESRGHHIRVLRKRVSEVPGKPIPVRLIIYRKEIFEPDMHRVAAPRAAPVMLMFLQAFCAAPVAS